MRYFQLKIPHGNFATVGYIGILSCILAFIVFRHSPYHFFADDAAWLIPSLGYDLENLSFKEQLSRDVGERGALSLNMLLRGLFLIFGTNISGYLYFGIILHVVCTYLFYLTLKNSKFNESICLSTSILFFTCSSQFDAIFWPIGLQHVVTLISIFLTINLVNHYFFKALRPNSNNEWRSIIWCAFIFLLLGFNRGSIVVCALIALLYYGYFNIRGGVSSGSNLEKGAYTRLDFSWCIVAIALLSYTLYQVPKGSEGRQIDAALNSMGLENLLIFLPLAGVISIIFLPLVFRLVLKNINTSRYTNICLNLTILFLVYSALIKDNYSVISSVLQNYLSIANIDQNYRWSQLSFYKFQIPFFGPSPNFIDATKSINYIFTCLFLFAAWHCRPREAAKRLIYIIFLLLISFSILYFQTLAKLNGINHLPSRYAYYMMPGFLLVFTILTNKFFQKKLANKIVLLSLFLLLITSNLYMLNKRMWSAQHSNSINLFATTKAFEMALKVHAWGAQNGDGNNVYINLENYQGLGWDKNPFIGSFLPPKNTKFDPLIFNTQAYLDQLKNPSLKLVPSTLESDIMICGNSWHFRENGAKINNCEIFK